MITVRVPSILRTDGWPEEIRIDVPVSTIDALVTELDRRLPGARTRLDDTLFNFAVNDAMICTPSTRTACATATSSKSFRRSPAGEYRELRAVGGGCNIRGS